jgi:hypothetical protein
MFAVARRVHANFTGIRQVFAIHLIMKGLFGFDADIGATSLRLAAVF